jgi:hypothetical protein
MKTFTKVILIISSVFIVIGLAMVIVALASGAKFRDNYPFETYSFTDIYNDVKSLDIKVSAGEVVIKEGEEFKIDVKGIIKDRFNSSVTDGIWTIEDNHKTVRIFNLFWEIGKGLSFINYYPKITIYVPNGFEFDETKIKIGAGKGKIEKMITKEINIDVSAGELVINNLDSKKSNIDCGVGSVRINGVMTGYNKLNNGVGEIELNLTGNSKDYNYKYSVGIGEVRINDSSYSRVTGEGKIDNNASNDFDIDCGIGSIRIEVNE